MKLAELRKLSIRKRFQIQFRLSNGMECLINEHGVAQVPELRRVPDFNLERELAAATEFRILTLVPEKKSPPAPQTLGREQLAAMLTPASAATVADHEED